MRATRAAENLGLLLLLHYTHHSNKYYFHKYLKMNVLGTSGHLLQSFPGSGYMRKESKRKRTLVLYTGVNLSPLTLN